MLRHRSISAMRMLSFLVVVAIATTSARVEADGQVSARYGVGFGATMGELESDFLYENLLRMEVLFGAPGDEHVRIGPALDLRTANFDTAEGALGVSLLLPLARGYPLLLTAAVGYATRRDEWLDGPIFVGTLAWGYRSYNFHSPYQLGLHIFVSSRVYLNQPDFWEITAGIEIDLEALIAIPAMFIINLFRGGPPDEPEEDDE